MSKYDIKIILAFRFFQSLCISQINRNKHNNNNTNFEEAQVFATCKAHAYLFI